MAKPLFSREELTKAIESESKDFEKACLWLQENMPEGFQKNSQGLFLIARHLLTYASQARFTHIELPQGAIVLVEENPQVDLKILQPFEGIPISSFCTFVSKTPPPGGGKGLLKVAFLHFENWGEKPYSGEEECQYEIQRKGPDFVHILLTYKEIRPKGFLYRIAQVVAARGLRLLQMETLKKGSEGVTVSFTLQENKETPMKELMREVLLAASLPLEEEIYGLVQTHVLNSLEARLVCASARFIHQGLVHADPNLYSLEHIMQDLLRHPELTAQFCKAFTAKLDPEKRDVKQYEVLKEQLKKSIESLDTGQPLNDARRKTILMQAVHFIEATLKTNLYVENPNAISFRLDPHYLQQLPSSCLAKFPELPFGIFFIYGIKFMGFHIRFKDLARGGVRTILPRTQEGYGSDSNTLFLEAYNLAYTQQKKNKDIPEGGAKTAILLEPLEKQEDRTNYLACSQKSFIKAFMTLINCEENGKLRAARVVDEWQKPEYIYLGPDENMSNEMITWIADYAVECDYKVGRSFMSSKPIGGINHKEYGVTSFGVNVYLHEALLFLGIDPEKDSFTVKMAGGPDGDVAGNEIVNLFRFYSKTAKLVALTDVSGTIYDPKGLDLQEMVDLFQKSQSIRFYPPEKLSDGAFLLDLKTEKEGQTLCWRKKGGHLKEDWLSDNETNHLYRTQVHQVKADAFIPAGGRPRTLNETNVASFLDVTGKPTAKAIVEGANLYLTPAARAALEKLGVLIFKDSSCNKGGVICSSFEVLAGLCMREEDFLKHKKQYVEEILEIIRRAALSEAQLLLDTMKKTKRPLAEISDQISSQINHFKYELLDHFEKAKILPAKDEFLSECLLRYCPPLLREKYKKQIFQLPLIHQQAMASCFIASRLVYTQGVDWRPSIADILPALPSLIG